jgi:single-stranded-DNA-specific exonuclease
MRGEDKVVDLAGFEQRLREAAERFREIDRAETIRVVSHLDSDGICAASLLLKVLGLENRKYSVSIVQQLDEKVAAELAGEDYKYFFFTDIGSGQLEAIEKHLGDRKLFVLDHHEPQIEEAPNLVHVNPHLFGIDGSSEVSGAGVVYFFARTLNPKMEEFAHLALIGALGDMQDERGFSQLNRSIIEAAVKHNKVKVIKGLRLFGAQTRPLHKVLEYSSNPSIPGVSGNESGAIQFLSQLGIPLREGGQWRKLVNLSEQEIQKLTEGIVMKLLESDNPVDPEEIIGEVYILREEEKESPFRDGKEFSTLLNACGRMGKASVGIGTCLGDPVSKRAAMRTLSEYRLEIVKALEWYDKNKIGENVIKDKGYMIINARDQVRSTIIGTLASIISKSNDIPQRTFIMSMAQNSDGFTKVSMRIAGSRNMDVDLHSVVGQITSKMGVEAGGGHSMASGALIPTDREDEFIGFARDVLRQASMEEHII